MYHSIWFGTKNSWEDWHLIPSSRPVVNPPKERTRFVTIEGRSGSYDYSQVLSGAPVYEDREGSWDFYVDNGHWPWHAAYQTILNFLQGRRYTVVLEDDPSYFYEGSCWVDKWKSDPGHSKITIQYRLAPYKRRIWLEEEAWRWDPFDFENGAVEAPGGVVQKSTPVYGPNDIRKGTILLETAPRAVVRPTVTITGVNLREDYVTMVISGAASVTAQLDNGSYSKWELAAGKYRFEFTAQRTTTAQITAAVSWPSDTDYERIL